MTSLNCTERYYDSIAAATFSCSSWPSSLVSRPPHRPDDNLPWLPSTSQSRRGSTSIEGRRDEGLRHTMGEQDEREQKGQRERERERERQKTENSPDRAGVEVIVPSILNRLSPLTPLQYSAVAPLRLLGSSRARGPGPHRGATTIMSTMPTYLPRVQRARGQNPRP